MRQRLALLSTMAFNIDRGEYLKIDPDGRIPAEKPEPAKSNDQKITPCTFGAPQFSARH